MKQLKMYFIIAICLIFFSGCCQNCCEAPRDDAAIEKEIRMMTDSFHNAIEENGFSAEFKYLDSSDQFFWVIPGNDRALSYDSIRNIIEYNATIYDQIEFHWDTLSVHVLDEDLASYTGIVGGHMHSIPEDTVYQIAIIESGIFIKRDSGWKFLCGQSRNN